MTILFKTYLNLGDRSEPTLVAIHTEPYEKVSELIARVEAYSGHPMKKEEEIIIKKEL
jgi:hypothetical protein